MQRSIDGINIAVVYDDIGTLALGGIFIGIVPDDNTLALLKDNAPDTVIGNNIFVYSDIVGMLTKEELAAVIAHELGHYHNGDLDYIKNVGSWVDITLEKCASMEFKADAYAIEQIGAKPLASALRKVFTMLASREDLVEFRKENKIDIADEINARRLATIDAQI